MPGAGVDALRRARAARLHGLYALTPDLDDTAALVAKVSAALDGGAAAIQYRSKTADAAQRRAQAQALARLHVVRGGLLIVNDDAELAAEIDADGVHIGEDDGAIAAARALVGTDRIIGVSCYNQWERATAAIAAGADYVAFGSFFASTTKPGARHAEMSLLARATSLGVPVVAIGGVTSANAMALIEAGADALAVIGDVFSHEDFVEVTRAAAAIAALFPSPIPARHP